MKKWFSAIMAIAMAVTLIVATPPMPVKAADLSGTYFIKNMATAVYAGPSALSSGSAATAQSLNAYVDQSWVIQLRENNYYSIKTNGSNLYLSVQNNSSSSGATIILSPYTGADGQLWSISSLNGGYRFSPKCSLSNLLGTTLNDMPYNGDVMHTIPYRADGYNYELWYLREVTNSLVIDLRYDEAYRTRYSAYVSRMDNCVNVLKSRLLTDAGINVLALANPTEVDIYTDTATGCASASGYNSMCSCGNCQNSTATSLKAYHHTNIDNVLYRLTNNSGTAIRAVFTGREMCHAGQLSHISSLSNHDVFYKTWKDRDVVLIKDFMPDTNHDALVFARAVLEMYGVTNHLNTGEYDCIFGRDANDTNVRIDCVICSACLNTLRANADEYSN